MCLREEGDDPFQIGVQYIAWVNSHADPAQLETGQELVVALTLRKATFSPSWAGAWLAAVRAAMSSLA